MASDSNAFQWEASSPERLVLPVANGSLPSARPPVRIFLGTEPAQFRAERAFVWSIVKHRDPSRVYEIHLMRGLAGYRRWFWTTQFTNYRFAVAAYAGAQGRAIYNDVDQVYLSDPAELFDLDMGDHGFLTLSPRDTSVMLIDCERMAKLWTLDDAQTHRKHWMLGRAQAREGLSGPLPPEWNARDYECSPGISKLVHFTTIHLQPWRPFPERFVYRDNPHGDLWFELEEEADRSGFHVFDRELPSEQWRSLDPRPEPASTRDELPAIEEAIRVLARRAKARRLLRLVPNAQAEPDERPERWEVDACESSTLRRLASSPDVTSYDGVACIEGLEHVPSQDVGWVVDELFRRAGSFVFAALSVVGRPKRRLLHPPAGTVHTIDWWTQHFESASKRYPEVQWQILLGRDGEFRPDRVEFRQGGRFPGDGLPSVWVLADRKPGHVTQSVGLANELGWPYERVDLDLTPLAEIPNPLLGGSRLGLTPRSARTIAGRYPDLVISTGRRASPVARWIRKQSRGRTRVVQLGREGVFPPDDFDLTVVPSYAGLLPHPRRMVVAAPLSRVRRPLLQEARTRWGRIFESSPEPRIGLLVGGHAPSYRLSEQRARELGRRVRTMAESVGGSIFVTTSRRTPRRALRALEEELRGAAHFHRWSPEQTPEANPYVGYLALADAFVVTGESASMLADACSTGKPVFIYDVPRGVSGWRGILPRLTDLLVGAMVGRAQYGPLSRRGFTRPQRGLELLFSKLMARGVIRPTCDFSSLHETLVKQGLARDFDGTFAPFDPAENGDLRRVARRVHRMLRVREQ